MAWRRPGDKPLSEPTMESLLTHICVTRPQWVNFPSGHVWSLVFGSHFKRDHLFLKGERKTRYIFYFFLKVQIFPHGDTDLSLYWGRVTHMCVGKLSIIGSDNGLSPERRQAIIRTNAGILLIGPLGTNFSEILLEILIFSFKKMRLKVSSGKWRPFCLGLNVLTWSILWLLMIWQKESQSVTAHAITSFYRWLLACCIWVPYDITINSLIQGAPNPKN